MTEIIFWILFIAMAASAIIYPIYVRAADAFEDAIKRMVDDAFAGFAAETR